MIRQGDRAQKNYRRSETLPNAKRSIMSSGLVAIIILNWNGMNDTIECLQSITKITYPNYKIVVVDNASEDGSCEEIRNRFPQVQIIKNAKNLGFAEGSNVGIRQGIEMGCEYVLLLNNDTIVEQDFLSPLVHIAEIKPNAGMVGPKIIDYYSGKIQFAGGLINKMNFRNPFVSRGVGREDDHQQFDSPRNCEWLTGCCLLIPANVLLDVGLFNPSFFAYCEDVDLSLRMRTSGYDLVYCPESCIRHKGGASSGGPMSPLSFYLSTRNKISIIKLYFTFLDKYIHLIFLYFLYPFCVLGYCLIKNNFSLLGPLYHALSYHVLLREQDGYLESYLTYLTKQK